MEEFLSLEVTTLEWLLQQKVLNVESEMEVYYALERWLDSDIKNRLQYSKKNRNNFGGFGVYKVQ
jgi:hypothetical protein